MGFFKDFKRDFAQAVNELMPDKDELANEYDDEDIVNTFDANDNEIDIASEDMLENIDDINIDAFDEEKTKESSEVDMEPAAESSEKDEEEEFNSIPEAEIVIDESGEDAMVNTLGDDEEETVKEEILEAMTDEELEAETKEDSLSEAEEPLDEAYGDDELKAVDALDEENMLENTEDALMLEPEESGLSDVDLSQAVEAAINMRNEEKDSAYEDNYEEADMADIEEKINDEETTKEKEQEVNSILADDTTYITKGTLIKGNIETDGGIDVIGAVEGDVKCAGKLIIGGSIEGNIEAGEIYANAAKIKGEIITEGSVKIGVGTVVVGNVTATSAVIAGAVNGDIDVQGPVIVDSTAVIMGDIKSRSVQINNGAVIEGRCSQCYSEIDVKSFFE
ncbi:MAG: polymer-forming cytoskeletal protein [Lachnospiraceae bacterium]|nr:polymer-forming cytoskeletal protein [Lachnospiraceae bacterium]